MCVPWKTEYGTDQDLDFLRTGFFPSFKLKTKEIFR
jgi:hypothetical protein